LIAPVESVGISVLGLLSSGQDKTVFEQAGELAIAPSRGGIFHAFAAKFNTRKRSFRALSSVGKWPLVLTVRRNLAFRLSIGFVV
jgi:hypothetical protein